RCNQDKWVRENRCVECQHCDSKTKDRILNCVEDADDSHDGLEGHEASNHSYDEVTNYTHLKSADDEVSNRTCDCLNDSDSRTKGCFQPIPNTYCGLDMSIEIREDDTERS